MLRLLESAERGDGDGQCVPEHTFAACLLMANLCDLEVLCHPNPKVPKANTDETCETGNCGTFGYLADELWREDDFLVAMAGCIAASARKEPWPPASLLEDSSFNAVTALAQKPTALATVFGRKSLAAVRPGSTTWSPWKVAQTAERLARHGYGVDMQTSVVPLAAARWFISCL